MLVHKNTVPLLSLIQCHTLHAFALMTIPICFNCSFCTGATAAFEAAIPEMHSK